MSSANTATGFIPSAGFSSQCFPVRSLTRYKKQDDDGKISFYNSSPIIKHSY